MFIVQNAHSPFRLAIDLFHMLTGTLVGTVPAEETPKGAEAPARIIPLRSHHDRIDLQVFARGHAERQMMRCL